MLTNRNVERLAGGLLAGSVVAFMSHLVTFFILDAKSVTILLVMLYGLMIFLSAAAIYMTFSRHDRTLALFGATGFAAHGMLIVLACCLILTYSSWEMSFRWPRGRREDLRQLRKAQSS